jgi:hypothetical protein
MLLKTNFKNNKNQTTQNMNKDHNTGKFAEDLGAHRDNTGCTSSTGQGGDFGPGRGADVGGVMDIHKAYQEETKK